MAALHAEGAFVRLCKGAYKEPPDRAFPVKTDVDANYVKLMQTYLSGDTGAYLGIATHDEKIIDTARAFIRAGAIPDDRFEFQMLYGIRSELQRALVREGFKMRVYVPFGTQWYPYFMRRLAEPRPTCGSLSNFFRA
jgi:proline dehydrogenase